MRRRVMRFRPARFRHVHSPVSDWVTVAASRERI
jgi:hypothetical protein